MRSINETRAAELEERLADAKWQLRCDTAAVSNADGDPDVLATLLERAETSQNRVAEVRRLQDDWPEGGSFLDRCRDP